MNGYVYSWLSLRDEYKVVEMSKYVVIDIETANPDVTSICQIAIVTYDNGEIVDQWCTLVNPKSYFHEMNVMIHGITSHMVKDAPDISAISSIIKSKLDGQIVCSYGAFDRTSIQRLFPELNSEWLDIIKVVRRAWGERFSTKGYGLAKVSKELKIKPFQHHDALNDTLAAGEILIKSLSHSEQDLVYWLDRVKRPIDLGNYDLLRSKQEGNPNGVLYGETVSFTGELLFPRTKAIEMAIEAGCNYSPNVTKKVTLLVIGEQDQSRLAGKELSSKEIKARELIAKGHSLQLLSEKDFVTLVNQ